MILSFSISAVLFAASFTVCGSAETAQAMTPIEKINHHGGFENGISADMSAPNECVFRFFKFTTVLSDKQTHSGAHAAKVVPTEDGAFFLFDVELEKGVQYDFSAYVYSAEGFDDGRIEISKDGVNKEKITNVPVEAEAWTEVKHTFTAAETGKYRVAFTGFAKKDAVYYFDDIRFAKSAEMTPIEKINHYGGFENGISADMSAANDCIFRFFQFTTVLSNKPVHSGTNAAKVVPTSDDSFFLFDLELEAHTKYTFSTYVYAVDEDNSANNFIEISLNGKKGQLTGMALPKGAWTKVSCSFRTWDAGKYRVAFKGFEKGKAYYFDDIKFEQKAVSGDVNGDGTGNTHEDIRTLRQVLLGISRSLNTDINDDGQTDICDLVSLNAAANA